MRRAIAVVHGWADQIRVAAENRLQLVKSRAEARLVDRLPILSWRGSHGMVIGGQSNGRDEFTVGRLSAVPPRTRARWVPWGPDPPAKVVLNENVSVSVSCGSAGRRNACGPDGGELVSWLSTRDTCCCGPTRGETTATKCPGGDDGPTLVTVGRMTKAAAFDCERTCGEHSGGDAAGSDCVSWTVLTPGRSPPGSVTARLLLVEPGSIVPKMGSVLPGVVNATSFSAFNPWPCRVIVVGPVVARTTACGSIVSITAKLNGTAMMHGSSTGSAPAGGGSSVSMSTTVAM